jgi:Nucleotide modification associated domain 3
MKALLLRVGIDKGSGGTYGPIFNDGSFEFVPIPETYRSCTAATYGERIGRTGKPLSTYVPPALRHVPMHDDPEFETRTYGDPSAKRRYLLQLAEGDLLVFYAGLKPFDHDNAEYPEALYFVGYFTIDQVIDFNWLSASERSANRQRYPYNAHIKRGYAFENLVIVVGGNDSRLLNRAVLISEKKPDKSARPTFALSSEMEELLGISGFIQRSIPPRFVTQERSVTQLAQLLDSS